MVRPDVESVRKNGNCYHLLRRVAAAFPEMGRKPKKAATLLVYLIAAVAVWLNRGRILNFSEFGVLEALLYDLNQFAMLLLLGMGLLLLLYVLGTPKGARTAKNALVRIGFHNSAGETPVLLSRYKDKENPRITVWTFDPCGIPAAEWERQLDEIQAALNIVAVSIREGADKKQIVIRAVPARGALPDFVPWNDKLLSPENFVLLLGEGVTGPVTVDLAVIPHLLIGGATGSGKSVLLRNLLQQARRKGAQLFLADLKRGIDFPRKWRHECHMAFDEPAILEMLNTLVAEHERRMDILDRTGYPNVDAYNKGTGAVLPRIIWACDEVAELLDKTGRNKEQKELIDKITGQVETLARGGRCSNISIVLATQRPDAQTMPGQIKNNLGGHICGRADQVLSQIVLDNTDAATMIPKDSRGRFLFGNVLFQGYWTDDEDL